MLQTMAIADGTTVQFVMIDTVSLAGLSDIFERDIPLEQIVEQSEIDKQLAWLEETLAASNATWLIVCGHYPGRNIVFFSGSVLLV